MLGLAVQKRNKEEKAQSVRKGGAIPGVLYGPKVKPAILKVNGKEFQKVYEEAGESSLIQLESSDGSRPVLIREIQKDPLRGEIIHVDFYQPPLDEKTEVRVPLIFEGEAPAVRDLGGTLLKNIQEVDVRALPQHLPHEIVVDVSELATFEDKIVISDLMHDDRVEILRDSEEVVAQVVETQDIEAELEQPVVEDVGGVEQVKPEHPAGQEAEEGGTGEGGAEGASQNQKQGEKEK